jgi:hypothetical protein
LEKKSNAGHLSKIGANSVAKSRTAHDDQKTT